MKTLVHNQQIKMNRGAICKFRQKVTVLTIRGTATEDGDDPDAAEARTIENAKLDPMWKLAWTYCHPVAITANYAGRDAAMDADDRAFDEAVLIENGEIVEIEGRRYTATYIGDYSDPICFRAA